MTKFFWNALKLSPVILGALLLGNRAQAAETPAAADLVVATTATTSQVAAVEPATESIVVPTSNAATPTVASEIKIADNRVAPSLVSQAPASNSLAQVTSVSQLSDVQPTDWAFQALQSLVERYGCIAGYPDGTYRGNRALTRYEFAAGLNACLDRVNELIATATADMVTREDLATLQRLQEEFAAEIATLRGRVDALEAQTAELEANQFSTTTVLNGEVIISASDVFGDAAVGGTDLDYNTVVGARARLNFDTSFGGDDLLRTRLQAGNIDNNAGETGTVMTRLGYDITTDNNVEIDDLFYRFPVGDAALVQLNANAGLDAGLFTFNPSFDSSGRGSISRYGQRSPIFRTSGTGAGLSVILNPEGPLTVSGAFLAPTANTPEAGTGVFEGAYVALGQVAFRFSDTFTIGATYARAYQNTASGINLFGSTGSANANAPFGDVATEANHYGVQASLQLGTTLNLSGWAGYSTADALVGPAADADMFYWAAALAVQDFGREGNQLGVIFGQPPRVTESSIATAEDPDISYHLEGFYRLQLTENVSVTPGVLVIFNPEHNTANDTIYVGTLRTTFSF
ncbi:cyanobacterial porin [Gloeocapsa sp. PCC 7428]|uniref:iron uptake porin n=1 Tax=Gloeocapsa sp. PCC 7428 TaxID=1173026 RepID=UPI0002A6062C|nr:iron uptake porin [Gloeocapsa sp. PCC 7428]AFZ31524.1 cyanobacterial porin [Gloeocapsa sp. PCC 7428]